MPLQSDPTILYGLDGGQVDWGRPIYRTEIQRKTSHNTYQINGLPPTPICNPSREALRAVLNPSRTNYLYFVASGTGSSVFSETLDEHNRAVAKWRKVEQEIRAREAEAAKEAAAKQLTTAGGPAAASGGPGLVNPAAAAAGTSSEGDPPLPLRKPRQ
jgi:UPF0755 protein